MVAAPPSQPRPASVVVIGAGAGGLTAAMAIRAEGASVTLIERADSPGGKLRGLPTRAGPVDAGPTVLTLRGVFDEAFARTGAALDDYVTLLREPCLARHFWPDGSVLDLWDDRERNVAAVADFAGRPSAEAFRAFAAEAEALFDLFDAPMMRAPEPKLTHLARVVAGAPRHLPALLPGHSLAHALRRRFTDPRLRQLFGRYATYVGGTPERVPALLQLIWHAEAQGVWRIKGGLSQLARAMTRRLEEMGVETIFGAEVERIETQGGRVIGVQLSSGRRITADAVVFNGDPGAFDAGALLPGAGGPGAGRARRSLSARVWSFAETLDQAPPLAHHNVFFARDPQEEFRALGAGTMPEDPTIYVCAQDRGTGMATPRGPERFEIILNAPPLGQAQTPDREVETCRRTTFQTLQGFGLTFADQPPDDSLTTPEGFAALCPGSQGALYGASPEGMTAALRRPRARTATRGLYLAGGGVHPGPGLPMAARSGLFAARAVSEDLVST